MREYLLRVRHHHKLDIDIDINQHVHIKFNLNINEFINIIDEYQYDIVINVYKQHAPSLCKQAQCVVFGAVPADFSRGFLR
jgi:hypothetical protein